MKEEPLEIERLIRELKVNDREEIYEGEEEAIEPKEAMDRLIKIGSSAVDFLLPLLNHPKRYSCAYAVKVLGEIGDSRAASRLVELLANDDYLDLIDEIGGLEGAHILALEKIGPVAINLLIKQVNKDRSNWSIIWYLCEVSERVHDEKAFQLMTELLSSEDSDIQETVIAGLIKYGDKRAIQYLHPLLEDPKLEESVRNKALEAFRKLGDLQTYRQLLREDAERRLERFKNSIASSIRDIESAYKYPKKFEGDGADKVGIFVREHKIRMAFADLFWEVVHLGLQEAAISDKLEEELAQIRWNKIQGEISKLPEQCGVIPEIADVIASEYYPTSLKTEEKTYKNLRESREQFISGASEWLRSRGFRVIVRDQWLVWAWREEPPGIRGVVVTFGETMTIRLWGEAWTDEEANSFLPQFWQFVEKLDFELLRIPRTGRVYSWKRWREILIGRGLDTETIRSIENTLVYCYVSSVMGRRSIPPSIISHLELLSDPEIGLIYVSKCRDDPFSDHEAKTCRVKMARLTDAGLSVAKEIHLGTLDRRVAEVIEALSSLPEREMGLVKYFIGKRVLSEEDLYGWDLTVPHFHVASKGYFPPCFNSQSEERTILPAEVHESINIVKEKISSLVLATPSWRHTVSGFTEDILAVCPETLQRLSKEMGSYELDSYLWSCQRFIQFLKAKLDLLLNLAPFGKKGWFYSTRPHLHEHYGGMITNRDVRRFAEDFGIPEPVILDWLRELHDEFPELISEIDEEAMDEDATICHIAEGDRYELDEPPPRWAVISYPKLVEMLKAETVEEAYLEVLENVKEWFATGEKRPFTVYLKIERSLRHPLNFSSCTHVKDRAETEKMYKG